MPSQSIYNGISLQEILDYVGDADPNLVSIDAYMYYGGDYDLELNWIERENK